MVQKNKQNKTTGMSHKGFIVGKSLMPNAGNRAWYTKQLNDLVAGMEEKTRNDILRIWEQVSKGHGTLESQERILLHKLEEYYQQQFENKAKELASSMVRRQNRSVASALNESIKGFALSSKTSPLTTVASSRVTGNVLRDIKATIQNNISLIKSLQSEYHSKVSEAVYRAIIQGEGNDVLKDALLKYGAETKRRARNIAKDQSHKTYEALSRSRMEQAGFKYWIWKHGSGTKTVRKYHILDYKHGGLNNSIHKLGQKAYDPTKGIEREILPGELPYCSCRMAPVLKFED